MYKRNIETRSLNHCFRAKSVSVTYFEYVSLSLVIQHVKRMSLIILNPVGSVAVPYLSTRFHKLHNFRKNVIGHKTCILIFTATFV